MAEQRLQTPTLDQTRAFLAKLSITSETACTAGISPSQVPTLLQAGVDTLDTLGPSLQTSESAVRTARRDLASLRKHAADHLDTGLQPIIQQAEATLASNTAAQALLYQTAFESVTAPFSQEQRALMTALRSNAGQGVPTEYKVVTRTAEQWSDLHKALQHVRSRQACGMTPLAEQLAVVTSASSDTAVGAARQRLANLSTISAAWGAAEIP